MSTLTVNQNGQDMRALSKAVTSVGKELRLNQLALAQILGVSQSSISRMNEGNFEFKPGTKVRELALLLVKIYRSLDLILGDSQNEVDWLHSYNRELSGVPSELIKSIEGLIDVANYLDAYRAGI
jgi:transcriptional regulator with XRE-family HTH domain